MKQEKGITLVALVVTIIILLILAGVSINMIFGNEGIFSKTQIAAERYKNAQDYENSELSNFANNIEYYISGNTRGEIGNCTIEISKLGLISVKDVPNLKFFSIVKDNKAIDITKNNSYSLIITPGETINVYVIAIDEDANIYKSNTVSYTQRVTYLYRDGIKNTSIIHPAPAWGDSYSDSDNYLYGRAYDPGDNYSSVPVYLIQNINVTNISHIYLHCYDVNISSADNTLFASICSSYHSTYYYPTDCLAIDKVANQDVTNGEFLLDIDVSELSGTYNLTFGGATVKDYEKNYDNKYTGTVDYKIDLIYYE